MQGSAFLGPHTGEPPEFLHGFRGRMDEREDLVRAVRDAVAAGVERAFDLQQQHEVSHFDVLDQRDLVLFDE